MFDTIETKLYSHFQAILNVIQIYWIGWDEICKQADKWMDTISRMMHLF
jgi:hypothetical protein